MAKLELECDIDHMMYILFLTATVTQNVINRKLSNCMFKEVEASGPFYFSGCIQPREEMQRKHATDKGIY